MPNKTDVKTSIDDCSLETYDSQIKALSQKKFKLGDRVKLEWYDEPQILYAVRQGKIIIKDEKTGLVDSFDPSVFEFVTIIN